MSVLRQLQALYTEALVEQQEEERKATQHAQRAIEEAWENTWLPGLKASVKICKKEIECKLTDIHPDTAAPLVVEFIKSKELKCSGLYKGAGWLEFRLWF